MSKLGDLQRAHARHLRDAATIEDQMAAEFDGGVPVPPDPPDPIPIPPDPIPPGVKVMEMDWANPQRLFTASVGGFGPGDVIAVKFTTGNSGTANALPKLAAAEYQDPPSARYAVISKAPGDFTQAANNLYSGPSNSVTVAFAIRPGSNVFYGALDQGTTYYFNIRNEGGGSGNMFIDLIKSGVP